MFKIPLKNSLFFHVFFFFSLSLQGQHLAVGDYSFDFLELKMNYQSLIEADSSFVDKKDQIIQEFLDEKFKLVDALSSGIGQSPEYIEEFRAFRKELAAPFLLDKRLLDSMILESYERMKNERKVSHILVKLPPNPSVGDTLLANQKIQSIYKRILQGESFEDLAMQYSEDEFSASKRGELGYLTSLQTQCPFENWMYQLKINEISQPFRTLSGYHIIRINDIRENSGKIRLAHILVSIGVDAPNTEQIEAKNKIDQINQYLLKGETFEDVCKNFSEDPYSRGRGGEIRKWYFSSDLDEFLQSKLFTLNEIGDLSAPIRTNLGWHIFKLIDRKPLLELEEMEDFIRRKIQTDESRLKVLKDSFIEKNLKEFNLVVNEEMKQIAFDRFLGDRMANEPFLQEKIISFKDTAYSVKNFYDFIRGQQRLFLNKEGFVPSFRSSEWFEDFKDQMLIQQVEENLESINPDFKTQIQDFYQTSLLSKMTDSMVFAPSLDDKNIQDYYDNHHDEFILPKHIIGKLVSSDLKTTLDEVVKELSNYPYPSNKHFPDIVYELNSEYWNSNGQILMDELLNFLLSNPDYIVEISSHQDPSEKEGISQLRLKKFIDLLNENGIPELNIIEKDLGSLAPLSKTNANRNSRLSFKFYSSSYEDLLMRYNFLKPNSVTYQEGDLYFSDFPELENVKFVKGINEFELNNRFYFLNLDRFEDKRLKSLEEAKVDIIKLLQDKFESEWVENCRNKYSSTINIEELKALLNQK